MDTLYHNLEEPQRGTIFDKKKPRFFPALIRRRDNMFYRRGMAIRYALQFSHENIWTYGYTETDKWETIRQRMLREGVRYKAFPRDDDTKIVVSILGDLKMPHDWNKRVSLIDNWIAAAPIGTRITGSRGFGGKFAGARPKSKEPGRYLRINVSIGEVISELDKDGIPYTDDGENVLITLPNGESTEYVLQKWILSQ